MPVWNKIVIEIIGAMFMSLSGLFYTAERVAERVSTALVNAGFASINENPMVHAFYPDFKDNFFVWFFFIVGLLLLAKGFLKKA